jgi:hypothetical protein
MEPIELRHFIHQKVRSLSAALKSAFSGAALLYTFEQARGLFIGSVPAQTSVLWHYGQQQQLHVTCCCCTFFTWQHTTEVLVLTGLMRYKFALSKTDVWITFHIFDPIRFCTAENVDVVHDLLERDIAREFVGHEDDAFRSVNFLMWQADLFFRLNNKFQPYGMGITKIEPEVRLLHQ